MRSFRWCPKCGSGYLGGATTFVGPYDIVWCMECRWSKANIGWLMVAYLKLSDDSKIIKISKERRAVIN